MQYTVLIYFLFSLFTLLLLSFCSSKSPIEEETFIKVYVDLQILQDTTTANRTNTDSLKAIVFKKYDVTSEDYKYTIDYYNASPEKWESFFNKATTYVEKLKQEAAN